MKKQTPEVVLLVTMVMICLWIASAWVFARFVHYHAQRQILAPADYTADVIPVASGTTDKRKFSEFRKSEDGEYYVRVATLGTAHHLARTTSDLLPPFVLALAGVVIAVLLKRKQNTEPNQRVQATG